MNIKQLKDQVDFIFNNLKNYQNPEEIELKITLAEASVGSRASSEVKGIGMGIDWESGQLRIEPSDTLVRKGNARDDIKPAIQKEHEGRKYHGCGVCLRKITKDDKFCRYCGQKLR